MRVERRSAEFVFPPRRREQCHAPSLALLPGQQLFCAWFAGSREGHRDTAIWLARRADGRWSPPQQVAKVGDEAHWNPVLFVAGGSVYLFFKVGPSPRTWRTYWMRRPAGGGDWSAPAELVPGDVGGRGPVKNKPIELADGTWLAPASVETARSWDCYADRSEDCGRSWRPSPLVPRRRRDFPGLGIIQPSLWQAADGRVHMLARSTAGRVYRANSDDAGRSWSEAAATALPNNNSGLDLVRLAGGRLVLALNPVAGNRGRRSPLVLLAADEDGERWEQLEVLEDGPGEYSYPAVIATDAGVAVAYTWRRRSIKVCSFACRGRADRVSGWSPEWRT